MGIPFGCGTLFVLALVTGGLTGCLPLTGMSLLTGVAWVAAALVLAAAALIAAEWRRECRDT